MIQPNLLGKGSTWINEHGKKSILEQNLLFTTPLPAYIKRVILRCTEGTAANSNNADSEASTSKMANRTRFLSPNSETSSSVSPGNLRKSPSF